jgi:arylsulfatase A
MPFFLYLPYDAVHERIYNPDQYDAMYSTGDPNKDVYYANVTYLDHHIGRLLAGLKAMGLEENTVVFFSSDNGPEIMRAYYGAWRSYGTSYPLYGQKRTIYEGGIRVPGIIKWPGKIKPGVSGEPNSTLDVLPTICELIGVEPPRDRELDGASMLAHLLEGMPIDRQKPLYWQYEYPECCSVVGDGYDSWFDGTLKDELTYRPSVAVRSGNYVLRGLYEEKFKMPKDFVLFDVVNDPGEEHELSAEAPEILNELRSALIDIYKNANAERLATSERNL